MKIHRLVFAALILVTVMGISVIAQTRPLTNAPKPAATPTPRPMATPTPTGDTYVETSSDTSCG